MTTKCTPYLPPPLLFLPKTFQFIYLSHLSLTEKLFASFLFYPSQMYLSQEPIMELLSIFLA